MLILGLIRNLILCVAKWRILNARTGGTHRNQEVLKKKGHTITLLRRFKNTIRKKKINTTSCTTLSSTYFFARVDTRMKVEDIHALHTPHTTAGLPRLSRVGTILNLRTHLVFEN